MFILFYIGLFSFAYDMCYSIKCPACGPKHNLCYGCIATRDTSLELKNGKHCGYRIYRCKTGHELHIPFDVKKGFELKDIEVFVPSSTKKIK